MQIGMQIGGGGNSPSIFVNSDPDGALTMPKGSMAVNVTTGVWYQNIDGASDWWPVVIPAAWGSVFEEDFIGANTLARSNTAGGALVAGSADANHWGITRSTVTAVGDGTRINNAFGATGGVALFGGPKVYMDFIVRMNTLSDGTNNARIVAGLQDGVPAAGVTDGIYVENDRNTNGDSNWRLCGSNNTVRTKSDSGIAAAATYQHIRAKLSAAGVLSGSVDGVAMAGTVSTNIPTAAGRETTLSLQHDKTLGAGAMTVDWDYCRIAVVFGTAR